MRDWVKDETSQARSPLAHGKSKRDPSAAPLHSSARGALTFLLPSHIPRPCSHFSLLLNDAPTISAFARNHN